MIREYDDYRFLVRRVYRDAPYVEKFRHNDPELFACLRWSARFHYGNPRQNFSGNLMTLTPYGARVVVMGVAVRAKRNGTYATFDANRFDARVRVYADEPGVIVAR